MSVTATEKTVPRDPSDHTFQMRVLRAWLDRVDRCAARRNISTASYIRQATTRMVEEDEASAPEPPEQALKKKRRS